MIFLRNIEKNSNGKRIARIARIARLLNKGTQHSKYVIYYKKEGKTMAI